MPLYEYRCQSCGKKFEALQKFSDEPLTVHPECGGGPVEKLISSPSFQFKGTGWYVTDYAKGNGTVRPDAKNESGDKGEKSEKSEKSDKTDSKPAETKTAESKPAAASTTETK